MSDALDSVERAAGERDASIDAGHRVRRGVVHTPAAIARWIVRACPAFPDATLIDPACGPGVFLAAALEAMPRPTRCVGLDVDAAAIALARRELSGPFERAGWPLALTECDALDAVPEVDGAAIVVGNPPWTARTASRGVTDALLDDFRHIDGEPLGERKVGVLSDAYVRFLRWATAVVERASGGGAVAMVVSSSFLDGRVHRGMRAYLARAFDRIELVDLGGSALIARDGARDENVFGVRPGVVILIAVRESHDRARAAVVRSVRLRGSKRDKLDALATLSIGDARFEPVAITPPLYRFVPATSAPMPRAWPTIDEWMPWSREGVQTNRDSLCIAPTREALLEHIRAFVAAPDLTLARAHFDPGAAADRLRAEPDLERFVVPIAYRPLDARWLFAHPAVCHRARLEIAAALGHGPLALVTAYKDRGERSFAHLGIVTTIADNCWLSARSSCRARLVPMFTPDGYENVGLDVRVRLEAIAERKVRARDVIAWLAAWLSAPSFRATYDQSLRAGPIRVPLPTARAAFETVVAAGERVIRAFVDEAVSVHPDDTDLVVGHHRLAPSPRTAAVRTAQLACDAAVRDLAAAIW